MTIDHYCERSICRGPSLTSTNSSSSNHSMSSHLVVPGIHVSRSESFRSEHDSHSGSRVLPLRSGSFREPCEIEKEHTTKRRPVKNRSSNRRESPDLQNEDFYLNAAGNRQRRRSSLPSSSPNLLHFFTNDDARDCKDSRDPHLRRVRSFKTTNKGVVNRGDSVRRGRTSRNGSDEHTRYTPSPRPTSHHVPFEIKVENSSDNAAVTSYYKVVVLGAHGVGKSSITQQFMTSEYVAFENSVGMYSFTNTK